MVPSRSITQRTVAPRPSMLRPSSPKSSPKNLHPLSNGSNVARSPNESMLLQTASSCGPKRSWASEALLVVRLVQRLEWMLRRDCWPHRRLTEISGRAVSTWQNTWQNKVLNQVDSRVIKSLQIFRHPTLKLVAQGGTKICQRQVCPYGWSFVWRLPRECQKGRHRVRSCGLGERFKRRESDEYGGVLCVVGIRLGPPWCPWNRHVTGFRVNRAVSSA